MQITWIPTQNYWPGRAGHQICAIVDHIQDGHQQGSIAWFENPNSQASANFLVAKDGGIVQMVRIEDTPWTNGPVNAPDLRIDWLAEAVREGLNPNYRVVTIEHEGYPGEPVPEAQYQATLWLHRYIREYVTVHTLGEIVADETHIIGHCRIDSVNRANCPGPSFPWARLLADVRGGVPASATVAPAPAASPVSASKVAPVQKVGGMNVAPEHQVAAVGITSALRYADATNRLCIPWDDDVLRDNWLAIYNTGTAPVDVFVYGLPGTMPVKLSQVPADTVQTLNVSATWPGKRGPLKIKTAGDEPVLLAWFLWRPAGMAMS